jgi:hypothetical protein
MRRVREFAFLLAILSLAVVPMVSVGCNDQSASTSPTTSNNATKTSDAKPDTPKPAKKKGRSSAESGSTTGDLGVKPPKTPDTNK